MKKRIVACLVVSGGIVVQSIGFGKYLPVGKPKIAVEFLNQWGIDEIIMVDIEAGRKRQEPDYDMIKRLSDKCHVPLTVGGGICSIDQIRKLMDCGVDKISMNHAVIADPSLISKAAKIFGNQCIVVSVDAKKVGNEYLVYDYRRRGTLTMDAVEWSKQAELLGAGEIFLTSVERDGSYTGFEIELMKMASSQLKIPVIASGGAGNAEHFIEVFKESSVSAASAANFFHFTEHSVITAKAEIDKKVGIRLDTAADYRDSVINEQNRLEKREDEYLEKLLYVRIDKEII